MTGTVAGLSTYHFMQNTQNVKKYLDSVSFLWYYYGMFTENEAMQKTDVVCLFRAVGDVEFYSIMRTKQFSIHPKGAHVKYFGLDYKETLAFADRVTNIDVTAIIEVAVLRDVLDRIGDFTHVDSFIFKSGTVVIQSEDLDEFNRAIQQIEQKY